MSLPALLLFHASWLWDSIRRPLLLVCALCLLSNPGAAIRKCKIFYVTFLYLALCKDKKWKVPKEDPAQWFPKELGGTKAGGNEGTGKDKVRYREKTVILIRHGESTWNDTFNPGDRNKVVFILFYVPNMLYAIFMEMYFLVSGKDDESWFYDSALSSKGVGQAEGLRKFLKKERMKLGSGGGPEEKAVKLLLAAGDETNPKSVVVCSNLRRAISTAAIGLADRFAATAVKNGAKDGILLLPSLQEISFNPDAQTILPAHGTAHPTWCDESINGLPPGTFSKLVDTKHHEGNKSLKSNGLIRLDQFVGDVFSAKVTKPTAIVTTVIATGHSLFFRSLFQVFLPRDTEHLSKKKKMVNGAAVMVTLREASLGDGTRRYMIDPRSIVVVYGGFGKHTKG